MTTYPGTIQTFVDPAGTAKLSNPDHTQRHIDESDTIVAIQSVIGTTAGTSVLKNVLAGQFVATTAGTETLTNKTINNAVMGTPAITGGTMATGVINSSTIGTATITSSTIGVSNLISFNAPQGFLINGKIVPSVASNNLTVAIKGIDGNDPSATNPVYVRIGDTVRSITSALSVTKNAGTNWFGSGSAELATLEVDYFVYLGYNATDGVVIGFARIPFAKEYDDFSTTATDNKYCAISTITNAAAGDDYEVVGRFAAILSGAAGHAWSVPTFTNKNLIQRPIFNTRWLSFTPTVTASGSLTISNYSAVLVNYQILDQTCNININFNCTTGGSASYEVYTTVPFIRNTTGVNAQAAITGRIYDTVSKMSYCYWAGTSTTTLAHTRYDGSNVTTGGSRFIAGNGRYEI